jgi:phosphatidylserine/phosphatidylglycerophosphate/cardiolipin synthase-like enzyme
MQQTIIEASESSSYPWPENLDVDFRDINIGIARTMPQYQEQSQVSEIEAGKLAMIYSARKTLCIESQYFASRTIAQAVAERLSEDDGPEVILINPEGAEVGSRRR